MIRLKVMLREDGKYRKLPHTREEILDLLDEGKYHFSLRNEKGALMGDHEIFKSTEIAEMVPELIRTIQFNDPGVREGYEEVQQNYLIELERAA